MQIATTEDNLYEMSKPVFCGVGGGGGGGGGGKGK